MLSQAVHALRPGAASATERDGGSYNRLLTLPVQQVRWLSERDRMPAHLIPEAGELFARAVRQGRRVGTVALSDDAYGVADVIRQDLQTKARESEDLKPFAARCNEQTRRIAPLFALFDLPSEITPDDLEAAARLVTYSMESVETITIGAGGKSNRRQPLSMRRAGPASSCTAVAPLHRRSCPTSERPQQRSRHCPESSSPKTVPESADRLPFHTPP